MKIIIYLSFILASFFLTTFQYCSRSSSNEIQNAQFETEISKDSILEFWSHYRKATIFRSSGNWKDAVKEYNLSLNINPKHEDALFYLGNMYLEIGDYEDAEAEWKKLAELNPMSAKAFYQLGNLYLSRDHESFFNLDQAENEIWKAHRINKLITGPQILLGQINLIRQNYGKAEKYFNAVLGSNTKNTEACFLLGYISWKNEEKDKALSYFSRAVKYAEPKEKINKVLSEGDNRKGEILVRSVNRSMFYPFFYKLGNIKNDSISGVLETKYQEVDVFLTELNKKIK